MQQRGKICWGEGDYDHRANREIERGDHLTLHSLPAAGGQAREGQPLRCISGQAAAVRRVVVADPIGGLQRHQQGLPQRTAAAASRSMHQLIQTE